MTEFPEHLQAAYWLTRNNRETMIPISEMTPAELHAEIDYRRRLAIEHTAHAEELLRYAAANS